MKDIDISDFEFQFAGYGHYKVTYCSKKTRKEWSAIIDDMSIIDATKNRDEPLKKDLNILKSKVKSLAKK